MATSALSTSNHKRRLQKSYFEGANQAASVRNQQWTITFDWRYDKNAAAILSSAMTGIPDFSTWDKSATISASSIASLDAATITYVAYAAKVSFDPFTPDEIEGYREGVMRKLGFSGASTISEAAAAIKADAFTTNMVHGTKPLFSTTHERASGTRSNKGSTGFDRAAFLAGRNALVTWTNYQGQNYNLTGAGLAVEYHPDNNEAVKQAIRSPTTSSQNQVNVAADEDVIFIENPYLDDEDDVIVHCRVEGEQPFVAWERMAARAYFDTENGGAIDTATIVFGYAFAAKGTPDGAFGITDD